MGTHVDHNLDDVPFQIVGDPLPFEIMTTTLCGKGLSN